MRANKLTESLAARVRGVEATDYVDVVVELSPRDALVQEPPHDRQRSRSDAIRARQDTFERESQSVERIVSSAGGQIVGRAWINQTLRARVPTRALELLTECDEVASIDIARVLEPDRD